METDVLPRSHPRPRRGIHTLGLVLSILWLVASVAAGAWLFTDTQSGAVHLGAAMPTITSEATHGSYGGDAYTGIQNAAADTENAVVNGTNGLADFQQSLAESSAEFDRDLANRAQRGLGIAVIGIALLNFTVALSRYSAA